MILAYLYSEPFGLGGAHSDVLGMGQALRERGHLVLLASRRSPLVGEFQRLGGEHRDLEFRYRSPWAFAATVAAVRRLVSVDHPDVVTPQSFRTLIAAGAALWGRSRRPPIITTIHNVSRQRDYPLGARLLNLFSDLTIFESRFERDRLVAHGLDATRSVVIHNGVDLDRFAPRRRDPRLMSELGITTRTPVAGVVARLAPEKALDVLLQAWAHVAPRLREARLLVIGDGPLRASLETLSRSLGIAGSVVFVGAQSDVPAYLSLCDCFVLTSTRESFPLAAREAMGMGLAVIAPQVGGCPEVVDDGITGCLVPPGSVPGFARALAELLTDRERTRALGLAGRAKAERAYEKRQWVDANEQVFLRMIAGTGARTIAAEHRAAAREPAV